MLLLGLALLVGLTFADHYRSLMADMASLADRQALRRHDEAQDAALRELRRQIEELRAEVDAVKDRK